MKDGPDRDRSAPEDALCEQHPERPALATCPRCGSYACLACWHPAVDRCHRCLMRHPEDASPPIPWDLPEGSLLGRFFRTLATAVHPTRSAPAFAAPFVAPAVRFLLLTFVPLALVSGVIPFTHTLAFGALRVEVIGAQTAATIAVDILRAMGIGFALDFTAIVALTLPFVSLSRAYGVAGREQAALRTMLYRAWLLPTSRVVVSVLAFVLPATQSDGLQLVLAVLQLAPLLLLLFAMRASARLASGVGPFASLVVIFVPFALLFATQMLLEPVVRPFMPAPVAPATAPAAPVAPATPPPARPPGPHGA